MKKSIFIVILVAGLTISLSSTSYAMTIPNAVIEQIEGRAELARADKIEKIYRWVNGKIQYRRWNATQEYWIDADWIDL